MRSAADDVVTLILHVIDDLEYLVGCLGDAAGRALDLRSTGHGFKSYSGQKLHNNLGQVVHTYVPMLPSSITWSWPRGGDALWLGR